jgi:hypothetical protein
MNKGDRCETTSTAPHTNRRKGYVINPSFQWKYATTIALTVFLLSSILSSVLYLILHQQARARYMNPETYTAQVGLVVLMAAVLFSAVTAGGVAVWSIFVTHRICGPLYVLQNYFIQLKEGRLPTVRAMRRKDEFKELVSSFADAVEFLKTKKRDELARLGEALKTANTASASDDQESSKRALQSVTRHLRMLHEAAVETLGDETPSNVTAPAPKAPSRPKTPVGAAP